MKLNNHIIAFIDILGFSKMVEHDCECYHEDQLFFEQLHKIFKETDRLKSHMESLQVSQFSDSIVLSILFSKEMFVPFIEIVSNYQKSLLLQGILCRGGIAFGKHFSNDRFIFSKALIDAYKIESTEASVPRIIVSQDLIDLVYDGSLEQLPNTVIKQRDGQFIVHYLNEDTPELKRAISNLIGSKLSKNPSIRDKHLWLADYFYHFFPDVTNLNFPLFED